MSRPSPGKEDNAAIPWLSFVTNIQQEHWEAENHQGWKIPPRPSSPTFSKAAQNVFHARGPEQLQPIAGLSQSCIFIAVVTRTIYKDCDPVHRYQWSTSPSSTSALSQSISLSSYRSSFQLSSGISALHWGQQPRHPRNHPEWGDILCVHTCPRHCPHWVLPQTLPSSTGALPVPPSQPSALPTAYTGYWRSPAAIICP